MKKLIAILAVFAFMTAALFAQDAGTWSLSGNGQIGTRINFLNLFKNYADPAAFKTVTKEDHAAVSAGGFYGWADNRTELSVNYQKGGLKTTLTFKQSGAIDAGLVYGGNNVNFEASRSLNNLLTGTDNGTRDKLWGDYTFADVLNGILLQVAVAGKDDPGRWNSGSFDGDVPSHHNYTGKEYLLVDVSPMAGLNLGIKLPKLFTQTTSDFMDDSLRHIVFGVKYAAGDLGVAAQFGLNEYVGDTGSNRLFIGASYKINDQMSANFDFKGEFGKIKMNSGVNNLKDKDKNEWEAIDLAALRFGLEFTYNAAPLNARLRVIYFSEAYTYGSPGTIIDPKTGDVIPASSLPGGSAAGWGIAGGQVRINPRIRYNVIPESLMAELDVTLDLPLGGFTYFNRPLDKDWVGTDDYPKPTMRYVITPAIFFNFLGTGAADNPGTGMRVRWSVEGYAEQNRHLNNYLDIGFKWSF